MSEENNRSSSSSESSSSSSNRSRSSNRSSSRSRGRSRRSRGRRRRGRSTACTSQCVGQQTDNISYKQVDFLRRYVTEAGKIRPRRQTGNCAKHQRVLAREIKRARFMALLPYAPAHNFSSGSSGSDRS